MSTLTTANTGRVARRLRRAGAVTAVLVLAAGTAVAASTTDFEGFTPGTVNGQEGWTVEDEWGFGRADIGHPPFDEEVTDDGSGNTVWRFSNAVTTGSLSDQPFSPSSPLVAGETGANLYNDRGPDHTMPAVPPTGELATTNLFHAGFEFQSVTGALQPGLSFSMSPSARQSVWRNGFINITDTGSGFDVGFFDTNAAGGFDFTPVASGLSYTDWHTIDLYVEFVDGLNPDGTGNDVVHVEVNGQLEHVGTTWETYYALFSFAGVPAPRLQAVDALLFRSAGTAQPGNDGYGLYFDNVVIDNAPYPVAALTAVERKQAVIDDLEALLSTGDKKADKEIEKAIKAIEKSIDPKFWVDDDTPEKDKVFNEERKAVQALEKALETEPAVADAIDTLVAIDRQFAVNAIDAAAGGDQKRLDKADEALAKGDAEEAAGNFDKAINEYKKAWKEANKA